MGGVGGFVPPLGPFLSKRGRGRSNLSVTPRCGSLLLSAAADVRSTDDVIAPEGLEA